MRILLKYKITWKENGQADRIMYMLLKDMRS